MHKPDTAGVVDDRFVDGDPGTSQEASAVDAAIMNALAYEIISVIEAAGIELEKGTETQLRDAISELALTAVESLLAVRNTWTKSQVVAQVALADGANIAVDAALSDSFLVTLAGNRTLQNPTNLVAGQTFYIDINQDATGNRTLAYGNLYKFLGGQVPVLSTAANAKDTLFCHYDGTIIRAQLAKGYA